ncbi:hypothetical protein [Streptomyces sp. SAJ15]|uniref:aggregation-promoting factor C-terminal-like domain-containing protein n=1 Tax=Streptomyces sp. SAJ15 TaxID=2011095 RepID=UPI001184B42D|nr:hypothetical protein [Streptomyces sp. SAJ15]TVL89736.1 hypothetical protein CD790_25385 [Streptomyces sp. SAJ15]
MAIQIGSVEVDVVPNTRGIHRHLRAGLVPAATRAGEEAGDAAGRAFGPAMQRQVGDIGLRIGQQIGQQIATRVTASLRDAVRDGVTTGGRAARPAAVRQGQDTGGAFARSLRAKLQEAFRSMPRLDVRLDDTGVDADLARLRARMETLSNKQIGIDVDTAAALAEVNEIEARLAALGAAHPDVDVRADTAAARAALLSIREEVERLSRDPARIRVETDGTFATRLRAQVQAAQAALPNINLGADSTAAQLEIARLRSSLGQLADVRVGVDLDAAAALARIEAIQARLRALQADDADIDVRIDSAAALAELAAVQAMVSALDGREAEVRVQTRGAASAILQLAIAVGTLATLPALPVLAAGLGAVTAAAVTAAVGVGALAAVAVPAFLAIGRALQARKAAEDAAATASLKSGQVASQSAARALQMAGVQQSLASAYRNAARQIQQAEQGVADAKRSAAEANRRAAQQVKQAEEGAADAAQQAADRQRDAAQQVKDARQGLASAIQQAADQQRAADERVVAAEQSLEDAQRSAKQAQLDLTQARRDAAMELEDLGHRLASAQLSERDAVLSVQEAELRLRATQAAGSTATALERERAQLAYDQAVQRLEEQRLQTKRLEKQKKKADKAGVEGSDRVKDAQERLKEAERQVREQTADLAKAQREAARQQQVNALAIAAAQERVADSQRDAARVQRDSAEAIAAAQEKVAEAQRNATRVQEDGARSVGRAQESLAHAHVSAADSIASAQRQVESAALDTAGGVDQAAAAQAKYRDELAKMTPSARDTFDSFVSLKGAFSDWSKSLQPAVMPIFTRALNGIKNSLPGLTPIVLGAADGVKKLQDRVSAGFKKPWWKEFKKDLAGSVGPAIVGVGVAFGNVFKGMAGIIQAFLPHMDSINGRMERITGRFANWGTSLKGSPEFERFLAYSAEMGPLVAETLGSIGSAFMEVGRALRPLSGPVLEVIGILAEGIASIARDAPWLIQGLYLLWIGTRLWTLAVAALNLVLSANPIVLIAVAILALVAAVVYAYQNFEWFRDIVDAVWDGIKSATLTVWNSALKPTFAAIRDGLQWVGDKAVWLWKHAIGPAFDGIALAAGILIGVILTVLIAPLYLAFQGVAAVATWLWKEAIKPAFEGIASLAGWLWTQGISPAFDGVAKVTRWLYNNVVKPVFAAIEGAFRGVARVGSWLWTKALAPAWRGIATVTRWLYEKAIAPVFSSIGTVIGFVWRTAIKPVFNAIKEAVGKVADAFDEAAKAIKTAWDKIKQYTKAPINWVLKHVWNEGVVKVWQKITGWIPGVPSLGKVEYLAQGGTVPAQPGVFNRPTAIVGEGNPRYPEYVIPTDPKYRSRAVSLHKAAGTQLLAKGGVLGDVWDGIGDAGAKLGGFFSNPMKKVTGLLDPLLKKGQHLKKTSFGKVALGLPRMAITSLKDLVSSVIDKVFGSGTERVVDALKWARTQTGKPYQWGGAGNPSWDCSGFMAAIQKKILGQNPKGRLWSTHAFQGNTAPKGWKRNLVAPFMIGITNRGVGHTAGTLAGVNVESRGGDGVLVGSRARGARDPLFDAVYGFEPSISPIGGSSGPQAAQAAARQMMGEFGFSQKQWPPLKKLWDHESGWRWNALNKFSGAYGIPQALPASKMRSAGPDWRTNAGTQIKWGLGYIRDRYGSPAAAWEFWNKQFPHWYDQGGYLQPGLNLAYNGTGRPEPVFTSQQANALMRLAADPGASLGDLHVQVYVGDREITDIARAEVRRSNGELVTALRANRRGG